MKRCQLALLCGAGALAGALPCVGAEMLSNGRFENMLIERPEGEVQRVVYFLVGETPLRDEIQLLTRELVATGTLVARIDATGLLEGLQDAKAGCVDLGADFEGLSHFLEAHYRLPTYHPPYFVGFSAGAALGYVAMAEAPNSTYAGFLSWDFCPELKVQTPLCRGDNLRTASHPLTASTGLLPLTRVHTRWVVQPAAGASCDTRSTYAFLDRLPASDLLTVRRPPPRAADSGRSLQEALGQLFAIPAPATPPHSDVADLPLVEVLGGNARVTQFAVLMSGDGGWTGLDKDVAAALAGNGVVVVGWDSLRYFWKARTPDEVATDTARLIDHYRERWPQAQVLLLGYSQGANVLPFIVNRLPAAVRNTVSLVALTGLENAADFEFHFANWVAGSSNALPTMPEINQMTLRALCIYGKDDDDSICPSIRNPSVRVVALPGGHHFNGDYQAIARAILQAAKENAAQ